MENRRRRPAKKSGARGARRSTGNAAKRTDSHPPARRSAVRNRLSQRVRKGARPLKPAPARTRVTARPPSIRASGAEAQAVVQALQMRLTSLEAEAQLSRAYQAVGGIETRITDLSLELDSLRDRGYVHSGQLEDRLGAVDEQWDELLPRLEDSLRDQIRRLNDDLIQTERKVARASMGQAAAVSAARTAVDGLERRIQAAEQSLHGQYGGVQNELRLIDLAIDRKQWMMDQLEGSPDINLQEAEGPLMAVEAEWHQDGDEGPKGLLFLTDQRLLFEQNEEIVTKRALGIFKSESETLRELRMEIDCNDIEEAEHREEGGFLGIGKDDILQLIFTANAPVSRAKFHLMGQESSEWAAMIERVKRGEVDGDRAEEFIAEIEEAESVTGSLPTQCPNCLANLPKPIRGASHVQCEYCGSMIGPNQRS